MFARNTNDVIAQKGVVVTVWVGRESRFFFVSVYRITTTNIVLPLWVNVKMGGIFSDSAEEAPSVIDLGRRVTNWFVVPDSCRPRLWWVGWNRLRLATKLALSRPNI